MPPGTPGLAACSVAIGDCIVDTLQTMVFTSYPSASACGVVKRQLKHKAEHV